MRRSALPVAASMLALTACTAETPAEPGPEPVIELVTDGLQFPGDLHDLGDGRLLLSDQIGFIYVIADGQLQPGSFLDLYDAVRGPLEGPELGLSGFAPHPDFAENGRFFVYYTAPADEDAERATRTGVLSEFALAADGASLDRGSERVLLRHHGIDDHIGGHMAFDADGMLLLGLGAPTGSQQAQDPFDLHGKVIRIDVDGAEPYGIPADNPFADGAEGAPEVYTMGHRNPWRVHFDPEVGLLIPEPMFTDKYSEVNLAAPGANFGYPNDTAGEPFCYEDGATEPLEPCADPFTAPVVEYSWETGTICAGAVVYRGEALPQFQGKVIAADWDGALIAAEVASDGRWEHEAIPVEFPATAPLQGQLWSIDVDAAGEVYLMTSPLGGGGQGKLYRLTAA
ncbi:PQQ-dependent sugar dehydrogenase [Glycomyces sp. NPDC048151]|uniref:PQQ-dependent sugar dehydrogenase n=1 Tax=Glycomyces sp. NPDC048151 TaxID=3364002 RepID=UPI00371185BE